MKNQYKKYIFLFIIFDIVLISAVLVYFLDVPAYYLLISALLIFGLGRLVGYPLRDFYKGFSAMRNQKWGKAQNHFYRFLRELEEQPWRRNLMYYNFGNFTSEVDAMAHNNLGLTYLETNPLEKAEVHLKKAIGIDDQYSKAHYNLAVVYQLQKRLEESKVHFEKAVELGMDNVNYDQFVSNVQQVYGR